MKYLLSFLFILLSACGFHLKGTEQTLKHLSTLNLISHDETSLEFITLQTALKNQHIQLNNNSPWKVVISDYQQQRNQTANSANSREIELISGYQVEMFYQNRAIESIVINNRTSIEYSSSEYIGSSEQEKNAKARLTKENAAATIRFIEAVSSRHPNGQ
ncbi:hypothetical protein [Suttonella ornithocola]|uniref:Lipopolysaccharide-assembly n=1 Tax=Suttonella ornithocola TaxID=279832 RepID=A0A380MMR2_9GAMM|nr:hypothetical protein [Suttonella ornithocola]SUO93538.1 Lipopolysaccharide-assembly [Suttonella ornithocola]